MATGTIKARSGANTPSSAITGNTTVDSALTYLNNKVDGIGTIIYGTNASSLNVSSASSKVISSLTLSSGTWLIIGGFQWSTSFTAMTVGYITANGGTLSPTTVRQTGGGGGGCNTSCVYRNTGSSVTIGLNAYNGSDSAKTASNVLLQAVRIA